MGNYSVLMSVYNKEKKDYLIQSIDSILNQTVPCDDFIIVCDGKLNEELDAVLEMYKDLHPQTIKLVRLQNNVGLGSALNEGMKWCKYPIIARMDSDDISAANRCEVQLAVIEKGYHIVSGTIEEFEDTIDNPVALRIVPETNKEINDFIKRRNPFNHPCVMYLKEAVENAGSYQHFLWFEDYYLWARMLLNGIKAYNIQNTILYMRSGTDMYKRRGGIEYLKSMYKFRRYLLKIGLSGKSDFLITVIGQSFTCIVPNKIRKLIYQYFLRE